MDRNWRLASSELSWQTLRLLSFLDLPSLYACSWTKVSMGLALGWTVIGSIHFMPPISSIFYSPFFMGSAHSARSGYFQAFLRLSGAGVAGVLYTSIFLVKLSGFLFIIDTVFVFCKTTLPCPVALFDKLLYLWTTCASPKVQYTQSSYTILSAAITAFMSIKFNRSDIPFPSGLYWIVSKGVMSM